MFKNYIKIAYRNIIKQKTFSIINLSGLAVGMASCLLIFLYVKNELSYDLFYRNSDHIYSLVNDVSFPTGVTKTAYTSAFPGPAMAKTFPEIVSTTRLARARSSFVFFHDGQHFEEQNLLFADSTVFNIFNFPFIAGKAQIALTAPYSLVLTKSAARKYFGDSNPIGKTLMESNGQAYMVTGILADLPANSHLQFDGLISMATAIKDGIFYFQDRLDLRYATYFLLRDGVKEKELEVKFPAFVEDLIGDFQRENNFSYTFSLIPLCDLYLHSEHQGLGQRGSWINIIIFSIIALFTMSIACINFMNLTTARSTLRAREVSVRKAIGARRFQLTWQFLGESIFLCFMALSIALYLVSLFLPVFNSLAGKSLMITTLFQFPNNLWMLGIGLFIGILAGSYPALALSRFNPVLVLRGSFFSSSQGVLLRKTLVVLQFAIAIVLIVGAIVVYGQRRFMQRQKLGFNSEKMLVIDFKGDKTVREQIEAIKTKLKSIPGVFGVASSWIVPGTESPEALTIVEDNNGTRREIMMPIYPVDLDFLSLYGLKIIAGREFFPDFPKDRSDAFIVNETAAYELGYSDPQEIVGKSFFEWGQQGKVIGVVKDFHYTSLHERIKPMNFTLGSLSKYLTLRLATGKLQETIANIKEIWQVLVPTRPFDYRFIDESFDAQYRSEEHFNQIVGGFSALAIFIACLGLFGLASFAAERRTKEMGIRKVLGATGTNIVRLLSMEFVKLVVLANILAWPIAYLAMNNWLQNFAYRIDISWWSFVLAGGLALAIAIITVSMQAVKAALANPVKSLRYE